MEWMDEAENAPLVEELALAGLCKFCIFRALSGKYKERYNGSSVTLLGGSEDDVSGAECCVCLGILQLSKKIAEAVKDRIEKELYSPSDYKISLAIPSQIYIREKIVEVSKGLEFRFDMKDIVREHIKEALNSIDGWKDMKLIINHSEVEGNIRVSPLKISVSFKHQPSERECSQFEPLVIPEFNLLEKRKSRNDSLLRISKEKVVTSLRNLDLNSGKKEKFLELFPMLAKPDEPLKFPDISLERDKIYITGGYVKLSREMSQTPWFINGQRKGDFSIEEILAKPFKEYLMADSYKFSAAGREDIDVRMLGVGRPFVLQLENCKKDVSFCTPEGFEKISEKFIKEKGDIQLHNIAVGTPECMEDREHGEKHKEKDYVAVVWIEKKLTDEDLQLLTRSEEMSISQKTPLRVMHRRSLLTRERVVLRMNASKLNDHFIIFRLSTSAGTYVKEFVHGDLGRTQPSVSSLLGCEADIIQLDVEGLKIL